MSPTSTSTDLDVGQIRSLLAPVLADADVASVSRADGGFINTVYRIVLDDGRSTLGLRIYAKGVKAFEKERNLLKHVASSVPVPDVLLACAGSAELQQPYMVYRWADGMTLNQCRRQSPAALLSLAAPLGKVLADIASLAPTDCCRSLVVSRVLAKAGEQLQHGRARARLGAPLADELWTLLEANASRLEDADRARGLAHGDFGGRNIVVAPTDDGGWRISAVLDWEQAFIGAALWDVGSLFRYAHRYGPTVREQFARGYREAGGDLPNDWYRTARLLDATHIVAILGEARELPQIFVECRKLSEALVLEG